MDEGKIGKLILQMFEGFNKQAYASVVFALNQEGIIFPDLRFIKEHDWTVVYKDKEPLFRFKDAVITEEQGTIKFQWEFQRMWEKGTPD